jgi:hypothetical protein
MKLLVFQVVCFGVTCFGAGMAVMALLVMLKR